MGQGSKSAKSQNGPRVKLGYCCLPAERVKLTVNSEKETNGKVKMGQGSRWAKSQDGLLLFTPERVKLTVNSKKKTNGPRVKMGQGSKSANVVYPLKESN